MGSGLCRKVARILDVETHGRHTSYNHARVWARPDTSLEAGAAASVLLWSDAHLGLFLALLLDQLSDLGQMSQNA